MRKIKFRAYIKKEHENYNFDASMYEWEDIKTWAYLWEMVNEGLVELMQFTNLKDKNNTEYYFDDIAKWNNKLWVVVWSVTLAGIELQPLANYRERQENTKIKRLYGTSFGIGQAHYSERLGNIHQNPELAE